VPELYALTIEERDRVALATLVGEVDASNADQLGAQLRSISNRALGLIVDLSQVSYLDSYGLAILFDLNRRLRTRQQRLRVVVPQGVHLRQVLELVGFDALVGIDATVAAARATIADSPDDEFVR
jgi:anti-anti-sigma factor